MLPLLDPFELQREPEPSGARVSSAQFNLGFLGLGHMGRPMAERVLGPDVRLHVFDPSSQAMDALTQAGAVRHTSPRSVADAATIVMACLPSRAVSEEVAAGRDGIAHGKSVEIYVEMSTIGRDSIESIAQTLSARGIRAVDAPITGRPGPACRGQGPPRSRCDTSCRARRRSGNCRSGRRRRAGRCWR